MCEEIGGGRTGQEITGSLQAEAVEERPQPRERRLLDAQAGGSDDSQN